MALKNTYTKVPVSRHIESVQNALIKAGAIGFHTEIKNGRISGITFGIDIQGNVVGFKLPINLEKFQAVMKKEKNPRWNDEDYVYRVAWACVKDWVEAQMAFVYTENATLTQVFLPYAISADGRTFFEKVLEDPSSFEKVLEDPSSVFLLE